jgi:arylsulfatase A-like enzyme
VRRRGDGSPAAVDQKLQDGPATPVGVTDSSASTGVTDEESFYATQGVFEELPGRVADGYAWPAYDRYSLDRVPGTAARALGVDLDRSLPTETVPAGDYQNVVVLLLDGYGWDRFQAGERPALLDRLTAAGETTPITSVYPTETAAAITSLNTGRTPAEHGLLGWNLRLPSVDRTVQTLPFLTRPADDARVAAAADGDNSTDPTAPSVPAETAPAELASVTDGAVDGTDLFDGRSVYERLGEAGVESHAIQPSRIVGGPYGEVATAGAQRHGVDSVAAFALSIRRRLAAATEPTYVYAYWPNVDSAAHDAGTRSDDYAAELAAVCAAVERELDRLDDATAAETLLVATADHGHRQSEPSAAVDLSAIPAVWENLARHDDGRPVLPTGGPRNLHLHVQPGRVETVRAALAAAPFDARILDDQTAIDDGLFGTGDVSPKLRERVGDLVVVPESVGVWFGDEQRKLDFVGQHGGQHPEETHVPFVATPLAEW